MIIAYLVTLASAPTVEVERAYAALAQTRGQWTAFRATAAPDAIMFVPEPAEAAGWLNGRADPPVAVMWWPSRIWISCDRKLAINYGPWIRSGGRRGIFGTVWALQPDESWKWELDRGSTTPAAVTAADPPKEQAASCRNLDRARRASPAAVPDRDPVVVIDGSMPRAALPAHPNAKGSVIKAGHSPDGSLQWQVIRPDGGGADANIFRVWRWDGNGYKLALVESSGE